MKAARTKTPVQVETFPAGDGKAEEDAPGFEAHPGAGDPTVLATPTLDTILMQEGLRGTGTTASGRRGLPGVASHDGSLPKGADRANWMRGSQSNAAKVPAEIAEKLAGREFRGLRKGTSAARAGSGAGAKAGAGKIFDVKKSTHHKDSPLLPGEGRVGTYAELSGQGSVGDNLTAHHMPSSKYMRSHGVSHKDGISMWVEEPRPGIGGRHRQTRTYGRGTPALSYETIRESLARDLKDMRQIYQKDGIYDSQMRESLQNVVARNKATYPELFKKKDS